MKNLALALFILPAFILAVACEEPGSSGKTGEWETIYFQISGAT